MTTRDDAIMQLFTGQNSHTAELDAACQAQYEYELAKLRGQPKRRPQLRVIDGGRDAAARTDA